MTTQTMKGIYPCRVVGPSDQHAEKVECSITLGKSIWKILFPRAILESLELYPGDSFDWAPNGFGQVAKEDIKVRHQIAADLAEGPHVWDEEEIGRLDKDGE